MTSAASSSPSFEVVHKSVPKKEFNLEELEDYDDDYYVDSVGESHMKSHEDYIDEVEGRLTIWNKKSEIIGYYLEELETICFIQERYMKYLRILKLEH